MRFFFFKLPFQLRRETGVQNSHKNDRMRIIGEFHIHSPSLFVVENEIAVTSTKLFPPHLSSRLKKLRSTCGAQGLQQRRSKQETTLFAFNTPVFDRSQSAATASTHPRKIIKKKWTKVGLDRTTLRDAVITPPPE